MFISFRGVSYSLTFLSLLVLHPYFIPKTPMLVFLTNISKANHQLILKNRIIITGKEIGSTGEQEMRVIDAFHEVAQMQKSKAKKQSLNDFLNDL